MGFFEKKINKWLTGFLLGTPPSASENSPSDAQEHQDSHSNHSSKKPSVVRNVKDFFKSGLKEMEKELNGNPMEDITVKKQEKTDK